MNYCHADLCMSSLIHARLLHVRTIRNEDETLRNREVGDAMVTPPEETASSRIL